MRSAGNDIVALNAVGKQRTNEFRFYSKILSESEQEMYHQPHLEGMPFEHYVWLLWSVKESAYKYHKRNIPHLEFSPTRFVIQHITIPPWASSTKFEDSSWENNSLSEEFYKGKITYASDNFYFQSKISEEWIATVVNDDKDFENVHWGVQHIAEAGYIHQSKAARTFLLNKLSSFFPGDLQIAKSTVGYPIILNGIQNMNIPVSLAHDARFVAFSFVLA